jgi:hypothetical protein
LGPLASFPSELIWIYRSYRRSVVLLGRVISPVTRPLSTQDNTNTEKMQTDIHDSIVIRTHDHSVRTGEATVMGTLSSVSFKCILISSSHTHIFLPEGFICNSSPPSGSPFFIWLL